MRRLPGVSQVAGKAFWQRRHLRKHNVDPPSSAQTMAAQRAAITAWREVRGKRYSELANITQPTLVVNGNHDIMVPTINSFILSQKIPQAQLIIYPDSGHAFENPNNKTGYRPQDAEKAWTDTVNFLSQELKKGAS